MKTYTCIGIFVMAAASQLFGASPKAQDRFLSVLRSSIQEPAGPMPMKAIRLLESIAETKGAGQERIFFLVGLLKELQMRREGNYSFHPLDSDMDHKKAELEARGLTYTASPTSELWVEDKDFTPNPYEILLCERDGEIRIVCFKKLAVAQGAAATP